MKHDRRIALTPLSYTHLRRAVAAAQAGVVAERLQAFLHRDRVDPVSYTHLVRRRHANRKAAPILPLAEARASRPQIDWDSYTPPRPKFIGRRTFKSYDLAEIAKYVDWGPFFQTWSLFGPFPASCV